MSGWLRKFRENWDKGRLGSGAGGWLSPAISGWGLMV